MAVSHELARDLLAIEAVKINTKSYFTWTSGMKSPIYCDNRLTMSHPEIRRKISKYFAQLIENMEEKPDVIAGCATAGIPHAAWLADTLNLPMVYVRSTPKGHGKENQIEGTFEKGQKVLVIEDLISTGSSSIEAAKALRNEGGEVIGVLAIFTYGLQTSIQQFSAENLSFQTITSFDQLIDALVKDAKIEKEEESELLSWRNNL
ncbi:orotate phosphoribosyltransferase [Virgibacillus natechei]|uniref:Orotate phosphoribosyltransferase n=1 Tax=Virgibacillus natechei TaxID=1216297 RepID=A0ABS4IB64_9BACI|nr:orotate phosphoribosyltransferase [Virgibacillus natechei]MBP1968167.1 orotate phosphoribosyltransferase [Virgibacillus natechei]UZD14558.1 orotate phosphoribosyltransferase [Virgibacillus natechei]